MSEPTCPNPGQSSIASLEERLWMSAALEQTTVGRPIPNKPPMVATDLPSERHQRRHRWSFQ